MFPTTPTRKFKLAVAGCLLLSGAAVPATYGQGCVVAHGSGLPSVPDITDMLATAKAPSPWEASVSYRWFKSHRHFVGVAEQFQRAANHDEVINRSNFVDLTLSYAVSSRYSVDVTVPFVSHDRSQVVKNSAGVILDRFSTQAAGLADMSVVANAWLFEPASARRGNIQVGLGLSLPTGNDNVSDVFETYDSATNKIVAVRHAVDQSIQPGSGGYGLVFDYYAYRELGAGFTAFTNGVYTVTPQEKNGVQTARSNVYEAVESIPDTYLGRVGLEYGVGAVPGLALSLGFRAEGVMVHDLVGGSDGFRRPGYSVAFEPGITFARQHWSARLYVPITMQVDRQQSVPDKQRTAATGKYSQGDAAFADYTIICGASYHF